MNTRSIFTSVLGIFILSLVFSYSLVFAGTGFLNTHVELKFKLSDNIFLDSLELNNISILFKSSGNLSDFKIESECNNFSKLKSSKGDYYLFELKFFDNKCSSEDFVLVNENKEIISKFTLNLVSEYEILSKILDLETSVLMRLKGVLDKKIEKYSKYIKYNRNIEENYYVYLKKNRILKEAIYNRDIIKNIISKRAEKYLVPVVGYDLPTRIDKIPNADRPYRKDYTDGIHHSWDIDAPFGEHVVALDDGIIVRVVDDWDWSFFDGLEYNDLSDFNLRKNLDILRGNQVWLKTMKGDVVFYGHLNDIFSNIEEGSIVKKGQPLGTIGISGVPDKNYKDYHLDFSIQKNPFNEKKVGNYDNDDYMEWEWEFKGKNKEYILANQRNIFNNGKSKIFINGDKD